jgi:hypothetical protein
MLGTLPADIVDLSFFYAGLAHGSNLLYSGTTATPQTDIFFVNAKKADSLVRVTNTPTVDEEPLLF